jgi:hypothetical protein
MKKEKKKGASPSARQVALGEENIQRKNDGGFPECLGIWHAGKAIF